MNQQISLDRQFANLLHAFEARKHGLLGLTKFYGELWVRKLSEPTHLISRKKSRNIAMSALVDMVLNNEIRAPFNKAPGPGEPDINFSPQQRAFYTSHTLEELIRISDARPTLSQVAVKSRAKHEPIIQLEKENVQLDETMMAFSRQQQEMIDNFEEKQQLQDEVSRLKIMVIELQTKISVLERQRNEQMAKDQGALSRAVDLLVLRGVGK